MTQAQPLDPYEQFQEASDTFERGRHAYESGRLEDAMRLFRRSHELTRSPDILYNIGLVADQLNQPEAAISAFEEYLSQRPQSEYRVPIERRLRQLRDQGSRSPDSRPRSQLMFRAGIAALTVGFAPPRTL